MTDYPLKTPGQLASVTPTLTDLILAWQGGALGTVTAEELLSLVTKAMVGLGDVDNTADADKPISDDVAAALAAKLDKSGGILTGDLSLPSINGGSLAGFRNKLINPLGMKNQRAYVSGAATSMANQFTVDRWYVLVSGQSLSWTESEGVRTFTAPAGGVGQVISGANILSGPHTISWTGTATCTVDGVTKSSGDTVTLTGGTNCKVVFSGGTFSKPQLEPGSRATPIEQRQPLELGFCQEYFWRGLAGAAFNQFTTGAGQNASWHIPFPVTMRTVPTLSFSGVNTSNYSASNFSNPTRDGARLIASSSTSPDNTANLTISAGGYLQADAEIAP